MCGLLHLLHLCATGLAAKEATFIDPQQRLLLEVGCPDHPAIRVRVRVRVNPNPAIRV